MNDLQFEEAPRYKNLQGNLLFHLEKIKNSSTFAVQTSEHGLVAERLGRGLQNLPQRFESARDLTS